MPQTLKSYFQRREPKILSIFQITVLGTSLPIPIPPPPPNMTLSKGKLWCDCFDHSLFTVNRADFPQQAGAKAFSHQGKMNRIRHHHHLSEMESGHADLGQETLEPRVANKSVGLSGMFSPRTFTYSLACSSLPILSQSAPR